MASRSKKRKRKNILIVAFILASFALATFFFNKYYNRPSFVHYAAFGIDMPTKYSIHGIDVSRYQKTIGWNLVKEMEVDNIRIGFVFMKATEGLSGIGGRQKKRIYREVLIIFLLPAKAAKPRPKILLKM